MAAPAWRSVGTAASVTTAAAVPGMPAGHTLDDILITAVEADASDSIGTDADYPHITGSPLVASSTAMGVGWKRHDGSEAGPSWPGVSNHQHAICFAISGAITTGTPFDILSTGIIAADSGTITIPGGTTLVNETLVVFIASRSNDSAAADFSAEACASLVSITEAYDAGTTLAGGGGLGVWYGEKAVAGAVGDLTFTAASLASRAYMVLGFRPPVGAATEDPYPYIGGGYYPHQG